MFKLNSRGNTTPNGLYSVVFTVVAVVAIASFGFMLTSQAGDTTSQSAAAGNSTPSVASVTIATTSGGAAASNVSLTENTTTTLYLHGTASDSNGCTDINTTSNWNIKFFRTNVSGGSSCSADGTNCIDANEASDLTLTGCSGSGDTDLSYEQTVAVQYYADPTNGSGSYTASSWTADVTVADEDASATGNASSTTEIDAGAALEVGATLSYGTVNLGATSSEGSVVVTNTGNTVLDTKIKAGGDMTCDGDSSDNIPVGNVEHSLSTGFAYGAGTDLATSDATVQTDLAKASDSGATTDTFYFLLNVPATGIRGTCSNTITFTAVDGN